MPPRQKPLKRGRWRAIALSLLLHSGIVAAAVFGWFTWKHTPPLETLAIEATVIDASTLPGKPAPPVPEPAPEPEPEPEPEPVPQPEPVVEEQGPPKPDPAEIEKRQEAERLEAEKQAVAKEAARKAAAEKAAAEKRAAEKKKADEAAAKKAAEEKARDAREAELQRSLAAEERRGALQNSDDAARWRAQIVARIQRAWIRPPSAQPGIECIVSVTQVPGGEVSTVRVISCNGGDAALRESVEAAVYRASPLPSPPDPALFERNLELTFAPTS